MTNTFQAPNSATASCVADSRLIVPQFAPSLPFAPIPSLRHQGLDTGTYQVGAYIAGATHLRTYLRPLGVTAYKIGISGRRYISDRIMDLRRNRYAGSVCNERTQETRELAESHGWFQMPLLIEDSEPWVLPDRITIEQNTIILRMSTAISIETLDERIHAALAPRDLRRYLLSAAGKARMSEAGYDPEDQLWTNYSFASNDLHPSPACELYLIRPRRELRDLVVCLADVVAALEVEVGSKALRGPRAQGLDHGAR